MGPIFTIYFLKFAQFICFFMSKYPDMMNPIIIIGGPIETGPMHMDPCSLNWTRGD